MKLSCWNDILLFLLVSLVLVLGDKGALAGSPVANGESSLDASPLSAGTQNGDATTSVHYGEQASRVSDAVHLAGEKVPMRSFVPSRQARGKQNFDANGVKEGLQGQPGTPDLGRGSGREVTEYGIATRAATSQSDGAKISSTNGMRKRSVAVGHHDTARTTLWRRTFFQGIDKILLYGASADPARTVVLNHAQRERLVSWLQLVASATTPGHFANFMSKPHNVDKLLRSFQTILNLDPDDSRTFSDIYKLTFWPGGRASLGFRYGNQVPPFGGRPVSQLLPSASVQAIMANHVEMPLWERYADYVNSREDSDGRYRLKAASIAHYLGFWLRYKDKFNPQDEQMMAQMMEEDPVLLVQKHRINIEAGPERHAAHFGPDHAADAF